MLIQINTDHNITVHDAYNDKLTDLLTDELKRFSTHITRLELHLPTLYHLSISLLCLQAQIISFLHLPSAKQ